MGILSQPKNKNKKIMSLLALVAYSKILSYLPAYTTAALTCLCSASYWTEIYSSGTLRDHKNIFLSPSPSLRFHFCCCVFSFLLVFPHFIHFSFQLIILLFVFVFKACFLSIILFSFIEFLSLPLRYLRIS